MSNLLAGIPEDLTRFTQLPNELGHNAVWDFVKSPDGRFFVSVCGENEKPLNAFLYEYYPHSGELRLIFDISKVWIVDSQLMPPSKIHTSIDFLPDGRLIMATHNTAPAPGHKQWMFEQYYEHMWEGYPGSLLLIVQPDTNEVNVLGIPVPRESIYGGMLGNNPRYYYFLGYMRGHFYRIDLETNEIKDYGKLSEYASCRLVKDSKGRLYGSSYTGAIWRYEPDTDEVTDLKHSFISPNGTLHRRQLIYALHSPSGSLFMVNNLDSELIELDPETLELKRHGYIHLPEQVPAVNFGIGGFAADENFVLYYGLRINGEDYQPMRLVRWDVLNGGKPENLGLIAPNGLDSQYIAEMIFDDRGWLHMVDVCGQFSPYILAVDVKRLSQPGPDAPNAELHPYWEPSYNGIGVPAYMHINAKTTRVIPLHQYMDWKHSAVKHQRQTVGRLYTINGKDRIFLVESMHDAHQPAQITEVYADGGACSCIDLEDTIAVLTTDKKLLIIDPLEAKCINTINLDEFPTLMKLQGIKDGDQLLASDQHCGLYLIDWKAKTSIKRLENIQLADQDAFILVLDNEWVLLSGDNNQLLIYHLSTMNATVLPVLSSSIRGRSFNATITGGLVLDDGTVVLGTLDGLLFTLSPDLTIRTGYGRLHSFGLLRGFIKMGDEAVVGIYGGDREAGHLFYFSKQDGLVDLGRPRVSKENNDLAGTDTEWANIHHISCLSYSQEDQWLSVGSAEFYGCIVRYEAVSLPG